MVVCRDALDRPITIPDRSSTRSPNGSIRTIGSMQSGSSRLSGAGSASTTYISPLNSADIAELVSLSGSSSLSRRPSLAAGPQYRAVDDNAVSNQTYLPHADPRVIPPSRMSSLRRTSSMTDLSEEIDSAVRRARARHSLGLGLGIAPNITGGDSPVTISSGPHLGSPISFTPPPRARSRVRGSETASSTSDDNFFSAQGGSTRTPTSSFYSTSSFTKALGGSEGQTGTLNTDETIEFVSSTGLATETQTGRTSPSTTSLSPTRGLARSRGLRRRTATASSRSLTSAYTNGTEESSDKENTTSYSGSGSYTESYPPTFSTLDTLEQTYTTSGSEWTRTETPTPSTTSSAHPPRDAPSQPSRTPSSSARSSEYVTARSPTASFSSLPTIPSESDFVTAEVGSSVPSEPVDYVTADVCPTETDYETADVGVTPAPTEFVTASVCPSEVSTDYDTAQCHCPKPEPEPELESESEVLPEPSPVPTEVVERDVSLAPSDRSPEAEEDVISIKAPSEMPSIPSESELSYVELQPKDVPLPPSTYTPSLLSTSLLSEIQITPEPVSPPPPMSTPSLGDISSVSLPEPSPIPSSLQMPSQPSTVSTISSPTESSVTPTSSSEPSSLTVPSTVEQPSISSPSIPESLWAAETDRSYDSSILRASITAPSIAAHEGLDTSFETSFMRPTTAPASSPPPSLRSPRSEISYMSPLESSVSRSVSLTPTPSGPSFPPSVPEPTPVSSELSESTLSSSYPAPSPIMSSSPSLPPLPETPRDIPTTPTPTIRETESSPPPSPPRTPTPSVSTQTRLIQCVANLHCMQQSPLWIPLPPSRGPSTPSVSARFSVTTPRGTTPSIHSVIETEPEPVVVPQPRNATVDDVDRLMDFLQDAEQARGVDSDENRARMQELRDLLGNLVDELRQRDQAPPPLPLKDRSAGSGSVVSAPSAPSEPGPPPPMPPQPTIAQPVPRHPFPHGMRDLEVPRPPSEPKTIYVSYPPRRGASPETLSDSESFLSSHHSDDWSLMESESYPALPRSPSWSSSEPSSPESSPSSSEVSMRPRSVSDVDGGLRTPRVQMPVPHPASPTESFTSSVTARPAPTLPDIRDLLNGLRREVDNLRNGQDAANRTLEDISRRPQVVERDAPDYGDRFARIEALLNDLLNRPAAERAGPPPTERAQPPQPEGESDYETSTDTSSMFRNFRDILDRSRRDVPPLHMPTPVRAGPTLDEQLADLAASGPLPPTGAVQPPPPLVPLIYRPGPRLFRPRSASPTIEIDIPPRAGTVPIAEPLVYDRPPRQPPRQPRRTFRPPRQQASVPASEMEMYDEPTMGVPPPGTATRPTTAPGTVRPDSRDIDMLNRVQQLRRERMGGDGTYIPGGLGVCLVFLFGLRS